MCIKFYAGVKWVIMASESEYPSTPPPPYSTTAGPLPATGKAQLHYVHLHS